MSGQRTTSRGGPFVCAAAAAFAAITTGVSYARWANFEYRTFDAAYYTQALWQLLHGRFWSSILGVPLLGNHVEPIILAIAPAFALLPHPITLVAIQNVALGLMAPLAYAIGRCLGIANRAATFAALALLLAPATAYVALHEFHPEAFAAPLILLLIYAHLTRRVPLYWSAVLALLACKENLALLVIAYCGVEFFRDRPARPTDRWRWYWAPALVALLWFVLCTTAITPLLNRGNVDYAALYSRPATAFVQAITHGNLLPGLILPWVALPVLRPRWFLVGAPVLLQHLLSWRSSEWTIYFHYAAPLIPLMWIASAEVIASARLRRSAITIAIVMIAGCVVAQLLLGPAGSIFETPTRWRTSAALRAERRAVLSQIPKHASVTAPLPYLSHLAQREELHSLHFILKGLTTLSRSVYTPPAPTDYVLIDYDDAATFDANAGYFHPPMRTADRQVIPSSEQLLHEFLIRASWNAESRNSITLLRKTNSPAAAIENGNRPAPIRVAEDNQLYGVTPSRNALAFDWRFDERRAVFPWLVVAFTNQATGTRHLINKGLCGIEAASGLHEERWTVTTGGGLPAGDYTAELLFFDQSKRAWAQAHSSSPDTPPLIPPVPIGRLRID